MTIRLYPHTHSDRHRAVRSTPHRKIGEKMANANQSANRAGNAFGRDAGAGFAGNDWENIVLKPGYILKIRDRFHLVEAVEGLTVDLYFNDSFYGDVVKCNAYDTNHNRRHQIGVTIWYKSMQAALLGLELLQQTHKPHEQTWSNHHSIVAIEFKDLEPYRGHLYHLCPSVPVQPKFMDINTGDFLVTNKQVQ